MAEYGAAARGPLAGASFDPRGCDANDTLQLSTTKHHNTFDEPAFLSLQSRRVLWRSHVLAWLLQHEVVGTNHEDARRAAAALCKACPDFGSLVSGVRRLDVLVLEEVEVRLRLHREEVEAVQEQVHRRGRRLEQRRLPRRVRGLLNKCNVAANLPPTFPAKLCHQSRTRRARRAAASSSTRKAAAPRGPAQLAEGPAARPRPPRLAAQKPTRHVRPV